MFLVFLALLKSHIYGAPRKPAGKRVLFLTISQIEIDARINKVARSMAESGYEVTIIAWDLTLRKPPSEKVCPGVSYRWVDYIYPLSLHRYYQDAFVMAGLRETFDYVHANDLTTLLSAWLLSKLRNVPLIYDSHEIWSENVFYDRNLKKYIPHRAWIRWILKHLEKRLLPDADIFLTVSYGICVWFKDQYNLKKLPLLLPNYPELNLLEPHMDSSLRVRCGLSQDKFLILYLGGVNPARNIESVIESLQYLPDECVFIIQGPGINVYGKDYVRLASSLGVQHRVFCLSGVGRNEVVAAAQSADCGVLMLQNLCLNFYFYYPNKLFEYMLAGLPVGVSNFPTVSELVNTEQCGVTFDPHDPKDIASALRWLYEHPNERNRMAERGKQSVIEKYNWNVAVKALLDEYDRLRG